MNERVRVLDGPNLDLLGRREPGIHGRTTLGDTERMCREEGERLGLDATCRQSHGEGELVGRVQEAPGAFAGRVVNAGADSHTSVALLDACRDVPLIEVHLSNIYQHETFRQHSYVSLAARGMICGLGPTGYLLALRALAELLHHD